MDMPFPPLNLKYKPRFPKDYSPGIGVVGCGGIVAARRHFEIKT